MAPKMFRRLLPLIVIYITLLSKVAYSQDACERITVDDLGRSDMLENTGLVATILTPSGEGENAVDVRILNITIVCEAQHRMQDRYRYTSVVVSFNCLTTDARVPECANSSVVNTEQFDLGCNGGTWSPNILTVSDAARTTNPTAIPSTGLDTDCILCVNPNNTEAAFLPSPVDSVTHCVDCANCFIGLQRCYYSAGTTTEVCCNYFHQGICVTECPSPLVPSTSFQCGCTVLNNANGSFVYTNDQSNGSVATLTCKPGFVVRGTNPVTCQVTGWTGMPTCEAIECEPLPAITNGGITYAPDSVSNYSLGTTATYSCNTGYLLDLSTGSGTRTCVDDGDNDAEGVFNGQAPTCVPIECEPLPVIANGVITYAPDNVSNYSLGTTATYSCNAGFSLDLSAGSETRTCVDDGDNDAEGLFTGLAPTCVSIECEPLPVIANGVITYALDSIQNYSLGTTATYSCNVGFSLDLSAGSETRTCVDDGDNDAEGVFNGQAPTCVPIECLPLAAIANGVITYAPDNTSNYALGTVATYACNAGYILDLSVGSETRTCEDDGDMDAEGVFTLQAPQCVAIECEPLPVIANGVITYTPDSVPNYNLGTTATYSCNTGFSLDLSAGSETRTCVDDGDNDAEGVFTGQAPTCVPIECEPLPAITNGGITYAPDSVPNYSLGTTATYSCNAGFSLDLFAGSETRTCVDDGDNDSEGVFNLRTPACVPVAIECEPLRMIANGVITYAPDSVPNYSLGTTATYSCNTGFSLDLSAGCETRTCVDDGDNDAEGVFNGQAPTCVKIDECERGTHNCNSEADCISIPGSFTCVCKDGFFGDGIDCCLSITFLDELLDNDSTPKKTKKTKKGRRRGRSRRSPRHKSRSRTKNSRTGTNTVTSDEPTPTLDPACQQVVDCYSEGLTGTRKSTKTKKSTRTKTSRG